MTNNKLTLEQKEKFFKNKKRVGRIIISHVKKKGLILFGQKATNRQLPKDLRKDTDDYDIFSKTPKRTANRIERKLDKKFKGNFFEVRPALHKRTHKVISRIGNKGIVDVSKPNRKIPIVTRKKIKLASLEFQKQQIRKSLKNPEFKFRHPKDREVRSRIKIAELRKLQRKKKQRRINPFAPIGNIKINPRTNL